MAPPRTFDYELLKRLVREHPEWPYADYADVLTRDARQGNPRAPRVKPDSVRRRFLFRLDGAKENEHFFRCRRGDDGCIAYSGTVLSIGPGWIPDLIEVGDIQPHKLAHTHSGVVKEGQHGAVSKIVGHVPRASDFQ